MKAYWPTQNDDGTTTYVECTGAQILNRDQGTYPYHLADLLHDLDQGEYVGRYGTTAETPPFAPNDIAGMIEGGGNMFALVNLDTHPPEALRPVDESTNKVGHWVSVLSVLPTQGGEAVVRVYDPFDNREKYYNWTYFTRIWQKGGSMNGSFGYVAPKNGGIIK
jgi:hypothetical protein